METLSPTGWAEARCSSPLTLSDLVVVSAGEERRLGPVLNLCQGRSAVGKRLRGTELSPHKHRRVSVFVGFCVCECTYLITFIWDPISGPQPKVEKLELRDKPDSQHVLEQGEASYFSAFAENECPFRGVQCHVFHISLHFGGDVAVESGPECSA